MTDSCIHIRKLDAGYWWAGIQREVELPKCDWQTELSGKVYTIRFILCHSPMCNSPLTQRTPMLLLWSKSVDTSNTRQRYGSQPQKSPIRFLGWCKFCWRLEWRHDVDPLIAKLQMGYILAHGGCPMVWSSKIQREVLLPSAEAEYNAMSESLRHVIHVMQLFHELKKRWWMMTATPPQSHCKVYEDNARSCDIFFVAKDASTNQASSNKDASLPRARQTRQNYNSQGAISVSSRQPSYKTTAISSLCGSEREHHAVGRWRENTIRTGSATHWRLAPWQASEGMWDIRACPGSESACQSVQV